MNKFYTVIADTAEGGNYDTEHVTKEKAIASAKRDVDSGKALCAIILDQDDNEVFNYNPNDIGG